MIKIETGVRKKEKAYLFEKRALSKVSTTVCERFVSGSHRKGEAESGLAGFASPKTNGEGDFMRWTSTFARQERSQWVSSDKRVLNSLAAFANRLRRLRASLDILLHSWEALKACLL
ncbi:hypothetical protein TNIN_115621 [Trichonephila inaurata madagascariensis]|uniref:Uncharacterized protein n=1 Tax=Trichonephila inaurata madagascariensis TaxID=2747483 RepID=A0A8X7BY39_9ARAC|nr:hypothetical protein TNIN_115621 [Trichonephila inaurata madagascariensis]